MNTFKYNIGYALSGGFIKGFAHLGIMQALHEHGITPNILSGVSAGALAAVFYADGREPYHIIELFEHHSFTELTTFSINKQGLLKLDSFIDFLESNLRTKLIEELPIPTIISATDLDHGKTVSFRKGKIAERVAASCCMPVLFAPQKINNTYYVDGGILMNLPVTPIREMCEKVIAFNVSPLVADEYKKNVVTIALRAYHFIFQANTLSQKPLSDLLIEPYEQAGKLIKAIYGYVENGEMPKLDNILDLVITPFKTILDKDKAKYEEVSKARAEAGSRSKKTNENKSEQKQTKETNENKTKQKKQMKTNENKINNCDDNEYDNDNDIKKENIKKKYGEYENVKFTDEEFEKVKAYFPKDYMRRIQSLDDYIQQTGKKYKDFVATLIALLVAFSIFLFIQGVHIGSFEIPGIKIIQEKDDELDAKIQQAGKLAS